LLARKVVLGPGFFNVRKSGILGKATKKDAIYYKILCVSLKLKISAELEIIALS